MNTHHYFKPTRRARRTSQTLAILLLSLLMFGVPTETLIAQEPDPSEVPLPAGLPVTSSGGTIFVESCAPCHGAEGAGDGPTASQLPAPPPSFADPQTFWEQSPADYFHVTKYGRIENLMPPWQNQLTDEQIWQAAYYAWSLHTNAETVANGQTLYDAARADAADDALAELDALTAPDALPFATNAQLADALQTAFPSASAAWSDAERQSVLDYIRTGSYVPPWESAYRGGDGVISGQVVLVTGESSDTPSGEDTQPETTEPETTESDTTESDTTESDTPDTAVTDEPLADHPVTLYAYTGFELAETIDGQTDAEGRFRFEELSTDTNVIYIVETQYGGVTFSSDLVELRPESSSVAIEVPVYESTDDDSGVYISRGNWIIDAQPGSVIVGLVLTFGNRSPQAFVGKVLDDSIDRPLTIGIPLPREATDAQLQDGSLDGRYQEVDDRIYDTVAVPPGEATARMFLSYRIPVGDDGVISLEQELLYPAEQLNLLIADIPGLEADVSTLEFVGNDTAQGFAYRLWTGESVEPQILNANLSGLIPPGGADPRPPLESPEGAAVGATAGNVAPPANIPTLRPIVPLAVGGLLLLTLAAAFVWPLRRSTPEDPTDALQAERERLIHRIARLDDQYALEQIPEGVWSQERARLKQRLLEISAQLSAPSAVETDADAPDATQGASRDE